ncbi:RHS repeat domain-containing protein [Anaeromyxobacter sp. Red801]|uniref:RHS repeat domain-containing protein n=1 Tax=Anaeromyxobacter sp. Red801 TaxID=3411632 RepID=UPI003BA36EB6
MTSYAYDEVGRVRFETVTLVAGPTLVTEYRYDADGNADIVVYPSGLVVKLERDLATGRVSAVRDLSTGAALASGVEYLPGGPIERLVYGNGTSLTRTYDLRYQPLGIQSGPVALAYVPTLAGDVATITSEFGEERFGYDFADRLVTRKTTTGIRSEPLAFVYAGDRLTQAFPSGSTVPQFAFGYDDQSNVSAVSRYDDGGAALASTLCLVHDALGRLVLAGYAAPGSGGPDVLACRSEADVHEVIARFTYDALGRRVSRKDADGRWTYFTFDLEGNPSSEVLISGDGLAPARDYVFLDGGPLVQLEYPGPTPSGGAPYFFHVDHLNRPRALTSASGQVVWKSNVLPSGEGIEQIEPDSASGRVVVTNLRLPGQYDERLLGSLGLQGPYYNWNRWYLPSVGRYMELDPIALAGGFNTEFGVDWYNYAGGNPLSYTDPTGLSKYDKFFGLPKKFWNWYHRNVKKPGDLDLTRSDAEELFKEWERLGKPGPDKKGWDDFWDFIIPFPPIFNICEIAPETCKRMRDPCHGGA